MASPLADRFWPKVRVGAPDECWPWQAALFKSGYGQFYSEGRTLRSHRVAWRLTHGSEAALNVLHTCDNPPCCNPAHLYEGTQAQNFADMRARGRDSAPPVRRGAANNKAKLTLEQVREIRASHESSAVTAARYGVSASHVRQIRSGNRGVWKERAKEE